MLITDDTIEALRMGAKQERDRILGILKYRFRGYGTIYKLFLQSMQSDPDPKSLRAMHDELHRTTYIQQKLLDELIDELIDEIQPEEVKEEDGSAQAN